MSGIKKANFMAPSPRKYVRDALATIGVQSRTFGTISHAFQVSGTCDVMISPDVIRSQGWLLQALPTRFVISGMYKILKNVREERIREKQKKQ